MIKFREDLNILELLKNAGYTTYVLRQRKYLSEVSIGHLRRGEMVSMDALNAICCMLHKKPQDIIEYVVTNEEKLKYYL